MFFNLACTFAVHHKKSLVLVFFKASLDHLLDDPESGKRIIVLEKVWEKSWVWNPKICTNPAHLKDFVKLGLYLANTTEG